ncbi:ankyrin, partial [Neocallimastix californiae]
MMRAIKSKVSVLVDYLIEIGADLNKENIDGEVPLIHAAKYSNDIIINILVDKGANVNVEDQYGNTPLFYAVKRKHISKKQNIIKSLIKAGANINKMDNVSKIPLTYLIERKVDNTDLIKYFLTYGTILDHIKVDIDMNIFQYLVKMGKSLPEILNIIKNNKFDVNQRDRYDRSMLDY